jgi:hypothetical protein
VVVRSMCGVLQCLSVALKEHHQVEHADDRYLSPYD